MDGKSLKIRFPDPVSVSGYRTAYEKSEKTRRHPGIKIRKFIWEEMSKRITGLFTVAVCVTLLIGWRMKRLELIDADRGIGYALGIFGAAFMIILFIYLLRKRIGGMEAIGSVKAWFRIHMILGIVGPLLILFHSGFRLSSINSNVALFSMLIVSASGVFGRYIYSRIHYGLYGELANLLELKNRLERQKEKAGLQFALMPGAKEELFSFANGLLVPAASLRDSIKRFLTTGWKSQGVFWKISLLSSVLIDRHPIRHKWGFSRKRRTRIRIQRKARIFLNQAVKVAEFNFYERLFSFWHILHICLIFILVLAVIMHIIAANHY